MIILLDELMRADAAGRLGGHDLRYFPTDLADPRRFAALTADADVIGFNRKLPFALNRTVLADASRLKFIQKSGSGADWFDLELLAELGILLATNVGFNAASVAEHAVALTLLSLRRIPEFLDIITRGEWAVAVPGEKPLSINGKCVGVIGVGAAGSRYARTMIAMGATVVCYHPTRRPQLPTGATWVDFDTLLRAADIISLHMQLTPGTAGMIGSRELELMKPTATLINTARGGVIDEPALIAALTRGRIRGAGLDVFATEPLPPDHPFRTLPNVVATPHVAGSSKEGDDAQHIGSLDNIALFVAGRRPLRLVNPELLDRDNVRAGRLAA